MGCSFTPSRLDVDIICDFAGYYSFGNDIYIMYVDLALGILVLRRTDSMS